LKIIYFKSARTENKNDILAVRARGRPMPGEKNTHLQQPLSEARAIQEWNFGIQVRLEQSVILLSCSPHFSAIGPKVTLQTWVLKKHNSVPPLQSNYREKAPSKPKPLKTLWSPTMCEAI
jgi:hypothetical protein